MRNPPAVAAGEQIAVVARSGAVSIQANAIAQRDGEINDVIAVVDKRTGSRYRATVVGESLAEVRE